MDGALRRIRFMRQLLVTMVVICACAVSSSCSKSEHAAPSSSIENAKSTTEAIQSGGASAAGPAPSAKLEEEKCPPNAKCDGYCAADQKQVADGAKCWSCTSKECDNPLHKGCGESPDPKTCDAIVECFHRTNCLTGGVVYCYCGDATIDTCAATGPSGGKCRSVIEAGFPKGTSPKSVIDSFGSPKTAGGFATGIGLCMGNFCAKKCVPYCASKS
jgi:hypothetical protein